MKTFYKNQLREDFSTACCGWFICTMVYSAIVGGSFLGASLAGLFFAGIPFGWKFLTKLNCAVSSRIVLKALLAVFVGWVALPLVLIGDIIFYNVAEAL